jgi:hypothetical protein
VGNDIIPFNEKGINRGRSPITFSLFNTNLGHKSNTITLSYSCHVYTFYFITIKICLYFGFAHFMFVVLGFAILSWFLCFVFWIRFKLKPILLSSIFVIFMPMTKGRREKMWKHVIKIGNDPMKMCFKQKTRWRLIIEFIFLSCRLWFMIEHILSWVFFVWACTYFLYFYCGLHLCKRW